MSPRSLLLLFAAAVTLHAETSLDSAVALYRSKDYPAARAAFDQLVAENPNNADAHFYLGVLAEKQGENELAIQHLERATELGPTISKYFLELGGAYGQAAKKASLLGKMGWAKKCGAALEKAVELDPDDLVARNGLISFYREAPSFVGGGISKAYDQAGEIKKRDPVTGALVLGQLYLSEKKYTEAFAAYEEALASAADNYSLLYNLGKAAAQSGENLDRGEKVLRHCLELTPAKGDPGPAAVHWRLGNIAEKRHDAVAAKAAYEASLKADPNFKPAADSLAQLPKSG